MSNRPTPETDAAWAAESGNGLNEVKAISRKLEREREEARERERVAILSFNEERQRALREGERVLEARRERDEAREQLRKASVEANTLATSIQKTEYPDAKEFELLGSVAGVISQIDNMYAGVRQQRDKAREDVMELQDIKRKHEHEELAAAQENDRLKQERDEAREKYTTLLTDNMLDVHKLYKAIELIKSLINQIERPAYGVDEAVSKMFLMEEAKKFANEVQ